MAAQDNPLGSFLRARREQLNPGDHGLPPSGRRQVGGLRREEVALLAGLSAQYYTRLEQGRDRHPSQPVLDALARVLGLDAEARVHLDRLVRSSESPGRLRRPQPERVSPQLVQLLGLWTDQASLVLGRYRDVLAANPLASCLNPSFTPGRNLVRDAFLEPDVRETYVDWEDIEGYSLAEGIGRESAWRRG